MIGPGAVWGFVGLIGLREMLLIAAVTFVFYGRSGMQNARVFRVLRPWTEPGRRPAPARRAGFGDRVYWFLAIVAATAVAAWVVTRMLIAGASGSPH